MSETLEVTGSEAATPAPETAPTPRPKIEPAMSCALCNKNLKHGDVVMLGRNREDQGITLHPKCLHKNSNVKTLEQVHIHLDPARGISSAMKLVVQSRVKALYKAIAIANAKKAQETGQVQ